MNEYLRELSGVPLPSKQNLYHHSVGCRFIRDELTKKYAWAIPSDEAIQLICKYSPIVEIGAGHGYWAYSSKVLRLWNGDLKIYDIPFSFFETNSKGAELDFENVEVTCLGEIICLGEYEVNSRDVLYEFDEEFKKRMDPIRRQVAHTVGVVYYVGYCSDLRAN